MRAFRVRVSSHAHSTSTPSKSTGACILRSWSQLPPLQPGVIAQTAVTLSYMKNLFESASVQEVKTRIANLKPDSAAQWGSMNAAQAMAHCVGGLETAVGDSKPPRVLIGYVIGGIIKPKVVGNDEPFRKNSPTPKSLVVSDNRHL